MTRTKKITVAFFLNKNVRPDPYTRSPLLSGKELYPLYIQVTYNRRNTQFRSTYHKSYSNIKEIYSTKEEIDHRKYEESLIKRVIEYEVMSQGKNFNLKGLNDRYLNYSANIFNPIDKYFRDLIYSAVEKTDSEFSKILDPYNLEQVSFFIYYKAASKLINDLDKKLPSDFLEEMNMGLEFLKWVESQDNLIELIDWLDHSAINAFESYLIKKGVNANQIKTMISFINRIFKYYIGLVVH